MSLWSKWGALRTNPFVDFSTVWVEPVIQHVVDVTHRMEPDLLLTLTYIGSIGTAYLFHSPFRAHSTAATDTYGRVTKVFQTWSTIVFFCFHLGPQFFQAKQVQLTQVRSADDSGAILYFPLFALFNLLFTFLHKVKRRWRLGVTYGSRVSVIGLNSLVLAAVATVHYAYCSTLYESTSNHFLKVFFWSLTPANVSVYPFRCIAKVLLLSCCFIAGDYQYKKWHSFDPSRGILWSELYELRKPPRSVVMSAERGHNAEKKDWREFVAPPRVYAPTPSISPPLQRSTSFASRNPSGVSSFARAADAGPLTNTSLARAPFRSTQPPRRRRRVLYHECPSDVNMDLIESWYDADDSALRRVCGGKAGSGTTDQGNGSLLSVSADCPRAPLSRANTTATAAKNATPGPEGLIGTQVHQVDHVDPSLTQLMSFRAPRFFAQEAQEAQHPVNRPGMVPWWSTFVLFTAWQTVAGATLRFLAFDVRTIQGFTTPKIFHLHFYTSVSGAMGGAEARAHTLDGGGAAATAAAVPAAPLLQPATAQVPLDESENTEAQEAEARSKSPAAASTEARATTDPADTTATVRKAYAPPTEADTDVWFDWIADVGDGFNPTYAMARLLAQPALQLPLASSKLLRRARHAKTKHRGNVDAATPASHTGAGAKKGPTATAATAATAAGVSGVSKGLTGSFFSGGTATKTTASPVKRTPTVSLSAPTSPKQRRDRSASFSPNPVGSRSADNSEDEAAGVATASRRASSTEPEENDLLPLPMSLPATVGRVTEGGEVASETSVKSTEAPRDPRERSREAVSASFAVRAPRRATVYSSASAMKTAASRALLKVMKDGYATLPRGSFVVVGGDLAYPSPDDETYTTRLFEPYNDALGGNMRLQNLFHAEQERIVVADAEDKDVAHLHHLDSESVANIATGRGGLRPGRGTAEEALRSVPMLFAIPGNHDWFDGLTTYRKYILERTWIGGWLMPQRSSFFVLRLPHNWFMLCGDTGNTQDIDVSQRNYFLDVIEKYMDAASCVILAAHEPGWLFDAMEREDTPRQPELNRVVEALGTRLRLRLAGDIHNYSRHVPTDPSSEAATLIVSGGGGAFLHGARNDPVISQGTRYVRACAFPSRSTFGNMASRLWGFRVVNWKFDIVVGFLCFVILLSALPLPVHTELHGSSGTRTPVGSSVSVAQVFSLWVAYATALISHVIYKGIVSIFPILFFWMCFSTAGADRHASLTWRLWYGGLWTFAVTWCCCAAMAFLHVQILYLMNNGFLHSTEGRWGSVMEAQALLIVSTLASHTREILGGESHPVARLVTKLQLLAGKFLPTKWMMIALRCLDPFETLGFLSAKVSAGNMAEFADDATRFQKFIYYLYVLFFYWILITPIVSTLIGTFLLVSVTSFDYMYDGTYSAFQIEDFKHFIRFRLDAHTRQLHAYVVAVQKPARVYQVDRKYLWGLSEEGLEEHRPPHLKQHPSRWAPMMKEERESKATPVVLEHFTVHPHRVPPPPSVATATSE